jgi:uncharacterized protein YdeI (YjbR/CyaY-like superfamily)
MTTKAKPDLPIVAFPSLADWEEWLETNHGVSQGIWLQFFKKGSGTPTVVYAEALNGALCYGWIDGQLRRGDEKFYLQRFTPRRKHSTWSRRNIDHVIRLEKEGKMRTAGWKAVADAQADGRWENAYDSQSNMTVPPKLMLSLSENPSSLAFFESLDKVNKYAIVWRIQSAKTDKIREKRMTVILEMLAKGEKIHP